jgi:glycosyltransferase involved in cell wall biosynthesis
MKLSVVIPTYKRANILKQCLDSLAKQTIASEMEVIIVSDGHDPETAALFKQPDGFVSSSGVENLKAISFFSIEKSQQGVARNRGVEKATAPVTLFIGDDIFLAHDACEKHLHAHNTLNSSAAVLGYTTWDPALDITPAMQWLEKTGWQFGYTMLTPFQHTFVPQESQERFTYTSNLSIPTALAKKFPFREDVTLYGWEDVLWGKQLMNAGIPLYYEPDASGYHSHRITLEDSLERIETLGQSLLHLTKIAPELNRMPKGWKLWAYRMIALTPTMRGRHYRAFLRGMQKTLPHA